MSISRLKGITDRMRENARWHRWSRLADRIADELRQCIEDRLADAADNAMEQRKDRKLWR